MEWILVLYLYGASHQISPIGPFDTKQLCEIAKKQHKAAIKRSSNKGKWTSLPMGVRGQDKNTYECLRTK